MISWHRHGQKVVRAGAPGVWSSVQRLRWFLFSWRDEAGPSFDQVVTINVVIADADGVWFHFTEFPGRSIYPAVQFRPVYPEVIDQLRRLDAPTPERVKEDA